MYGIFFDKSAEDSTALLSYVESWIQQHKLRAEEYHLQTVEQITTICREHGKKYSCIIAVGNETTFEALVSEARHFSDQAVLGYIPTSHNLLAKRLGLKDYKEGCEVVAQRKIIDLTALSANQRYFLFDFKVFPARREGLESPTLHIHLDKTMQIDLPSDLIVLHNRNQELLPHNSPLLVEAFSQKKLSTDKNNILGTAARKITGMQEVENRLQLRMPASQLQIESPVELIDSYNHKLKLPISIGQRKRTIRLIVKKGQELQAILSPGLIS